MAHFRFTDLPVELVLLVVDFAQALWLEEIFSAHAPYAGVRRNIPAKQSAAIQFPPCCNGMAWNRTRPICLNKAAPLRLRSPVHRLSHTCQTLRYILGVKCLEIWKSDNALFKSITLRFKTPALAKAQLTRSSILALNVCNCLIPSIERSYEALENVKLALPWQDYRTARSALHQFFYKHSGHKGGNLRQIDVEIYEPNPHFPAFSYIRMVAVKSPRLRSSRWSGGNLYYFSEHITSLYLYHAHPWRPRYDASLSEALGVASQTLLYLTIDASGAVFHDLTPFDLPRLVFLRLAVSQLAGRLFLRCATLPTPVDLHLELSVPWRSLTRHARPSSVTPFEVNFSGLDRAGYVPPEAALTQYAAALSAVDILPTVFNTPPASATPTAQGWQELNVVGLDVRIPLGVSSNYPVARLLPDYVSIAFAESVDELHAVLMDSAGRDWRRRQSSESVQRPRRSLSIRDDEGFNAPVRYERDPYGKLPEALYPSALYDTAAHVLRTALSARANDASAAQELMFAKESWLPDRSLGYARILEEFKGLRAIHFTSPALAEHLQFSQNMEGCLAFEHLRALAIYLNTPGERFAYPCPSLQRVHLPRCPWNMDALFNSPERLLAGTPRIVVSCP
ncbi:unnamed protein product [Peniophora sp. CBMAI 1063]|nr:unnamed protein product [Peniophora sp. CBMAI 1063]